MDEPRIKVYGSTVEITVAANAAGLRVLAERLVGLADPELRDGYHEHLESGINPCAVSWSSARLLPGPRDLRVGSRQPGVHPRR